LDFEKNLGISERMFAIRAGTKIRSAQNTELFKRLRRRALKLTQNFDSYCSQQSTDLESSGVNASTGLCFVLGHSWQRVCHRTHR